MKFFALPPGARFSNKAIMLFLVPLIFEQFIVSSINMVNTLMLTSLGDTIVAGVALINSIDTFALQFLLALAQGASVVLSQYIGSKNKVMEEKSLKENIRIITFLGVLTTVCLLLGERLILDKLFGAADPEVLKVSKAYFFCVVFTYPFFALYYSATSVLRVMGKSKMTFIASILMMGLNVLLKYIFIFKTNLGAQGAALSTLIAIAASAITMTVILKTDFSPIKLKGLFKFDFKRDMVFKILRISIPNGLEQATFQLGAIIIAGLVAGMGTASIVADQIARNLTPFLLCVSLAHNAAMIMVVGQCMGAGKPDEAQLYTKHILKIDYSVTAVISVLFLIFLKPLLSMFDVSEQATSLAHAILLMYAIGVALMYPSAFALPSALRGAGDTKFVMISSMLIMCVFRIAAAYVFTYVFKIGVIGVWIVMMLDWVIRTAVFNKRFIDGKWKFIKVI